MCESGGRGWQKLSFVTAGTELIVQKSSDHATDISISKNGYNIVFTNNDSIALNGEYKILALY